MKKRGRRNREDGAAAVEMAIVLPILFLLVFGIIEFGFIFNRWISVTHASREGVRQLSLGVPEAEAEQKAEESAPDLVGSITCTASTPETNTKQMKCDHTYNLSLFIFKGGVALHSTAKMRKE